VTTHTPGKWRVFAGPGTTNNGSRRTRVWTANGDHVIADCGASDTLSLAAQEANARVIAALPDLISVCELIESLTSSPLQRDYVAPQAVAAARAALHAIAVGVPPMIPSESIAGESYE